MIDVAEARLGGFGQDEASLRARGPVGGVDGHVAIEAMALLVAVERSAGRGHLLSPRAGLGHERLTEIIMRDAQQARRDALLPGRFDEVPSRLRLLDDVAGLVGVGEPEHLVGEYEAPAPPGEVLLEELHRHVALVDDVERIEDVVEAELHSRGYERVMAVGITAE